MIYTILRQLCCCCTAILVVIGLGLTISGAVSPAWQVVEIREFQHGLWWDCIRIEKYVVAVGDLYNEEPLHCMYKFDRSAELVIENTLRNVDEDGAAGESEHHKFKSWHKIMLFCIVSATILLIAALGCGGLQLCVSSASIAAAVSIVIAVVLSVIADGVFFLSANRVDNRFVQGIVGTYEQSIGYAFILHVAGTIVLFFAALTSVATAYLVLKDNQDDGSRLHSDLQFRPFVREEALLEKSTCNKSYNNNQNFAQFRPSPLPYRETSA